jgi:hypothetical protein
LQEIIKEEAGVHIFLLRRSLFGAAPGKSAGGNQDCDYGS